MRDLIKATGYVCVDFRRDNQVVCVRLDYRVEYTRRGYRLEFTDIDTCDEDILRKLKQVRVKRKILRFILNKESGKLPSTVKLEFFLK